MWSEEGRGTGGGQGLERGQRVAEKAYCGMEAIRCVALDQMSSGLRRWEYCLCLLFIFSLSHICVAMSRWRWSWTDTPRIYVHSFSLDHTSTQTHTIYIIHKYFMVDYNVNVYIRLEHTSNCYFNLKTRSINYYASWIYACQNKCSYC